jgi:hypothetical protein
MDTSIWISYISRFSKLINIDPSLVFTALVLGPIFLLVWWVKAKQDKQLTNKIHDIRITELPEKMDFFYTPMNILLWLVLGVFVPFLMWRYIFIKSFNSSEITNLFLMYIFVIACGLLIEYGRSRFVNEPAVTLSKTGIKYLRQFYSWDAIEKMEVIEQYKLPDTLVLSLKQDSQIGHQRRINIQIARFKQKWLPQYAQEYFLRCRNG